MTSVWTHQDSSRQRLSRYHDPGPVFDRGHPAHLAGLRLVLVGALDAITRGDPVDLLSGENRTEGLGSHLNMAAFPKL